MAMWKPYVVTGGLVFLVLVLQVIVYQKANSCLAGCLSDSPARLGLRVAEVVEQAPQSMFTVVLPTLGEGVGGAFTISQWNVLSKYVAEIIVVWDIPNLERVEQVKRDLGNNTIPVRYILNKTAASLNNRYLPYSTIKTEFVFQIDDDVLIRPDGVLAAFETAQLNPDRIVSFHGYVQIVRHGDMSIKKYKSRFPVAHSSSGHLGMTSSAMIPTNLMRLYWKEPEIMSFVQAKRNCEDIALNYVAYKELLKKVQASGRRTSKLVGSSSIYIYPKLFELEKVYGQNAARRHEGISSAANHYKIRTECVKYFENLTGLLLDDPIPLPSVSWNSYCRMGKACDEILPGETFFDPVVSKWITKPTPQNEKAFSPYTFRSPTLKYAV